MTPADFTTTWYDEHTGEVIPDDVDAHDTYSKSRCSCGEIVRFTDGDRTAFCEAGHRWIYIHATVEQSPGWRQVE